MVLNKCVFIQAFWANVNISVFSFLSFPVVSDHFDVVDLLLIIGRLKYVLF